MPTTFDIQLSIPPRINAVQDGILDVDSLADHDSDTPLPEQLYKLYLSMHEHQKRICCHRKKSTQYLLTLCGDYAFHAIESQSDKKVYSRRVEYFKLERQLRDALTWYKSIYKMFHQWSALDDVGILSLWRIIQKAIQGIIDSQPHGVKNLSLAQRQKHSMEGRQSIYVEYNAHIIRDNLDEVIGSSLPYILSFEEDFRKVLKLKGSQAQSFADLLDWVMDNTDTQSKLYRLCERALRRLCGKASLLPSSYYLKDNELARTNAYPSCGGGFADVYEGVWNGRKVAQKVLRHFGVVDIKRQQKSFYREAVIWKRLSHPNIVPFLGIAQSKTPFLCMVSSWMENGNLAMFLKKQPGANRLDLVADIARGLKYLHELLIVHGDVKSGNVLISADNRACLADFGLASVTHESRAACASTTTTASIGSIRWMAPEILHPIEPESGRATVESDIYALAMTMYEVSQSEISLKGALAISHANFAKTFAGQLPFYNCPRDATVVINVTLGIRPEHPGQQAMTLGLTDQIWSIMKGCWEMDRSQRPRLISVLECLENERLHFTAPPLVDSLSFPSSGRRDQYHPIPDPTTEFSDDDDDDNADDARYRDLNINEVSASFHTEQATQLEIPHSHIEPEGTFTNVMNMHNWESADIGPDNSKSDTLASIAQDIENRVMMDEF